MGGYGVSQMESHGAVGRSVGRSVSKKGKKRMYSGRLVMCKIDVRRKEAEGFHKYKKKDRKSVV